MRDPEAAARASLRRSFVVYVLLLALALLLLYYLFDAGVKGFGYVTLVVIGGVGLLLAWQVWMHIRDFNAPLAESEGVIARKWSRADMVIAWHSYYVAVGRTVFRLAPEDYVMVEEEMYVKVLHFPRTLSVVSVHEVRGAPRPSGIGETADVDRPQGP